jgi:hypothetical protein
MSMASDIGTMVGAAGQKKSAEKAQKELGKGFEYQKELYEPLIEMGDEQLAALKSGIEGGQFSMDEDIFSTYQPYNFKEFNAAPVYRDSQESISKMVAPKATQFNAYQDPNTWQNNSFGGQGYMTDYDKYSSQAAPEQRQISSDFSTQKYQQQGEAPKAEYYDPTAARYQAQQFNLGQDPVYQRRIAEGNRAIEASGAAQGMQLSGAQLKALQQNSSNIAAEEGDAAWNRYQQQDQSGYQRFQDEQAAKRDATQYKSEDKYNRFTNERQYGAEQNKESFLREQAAKEMGRSLNDDEYQQWIATDGQKYAQYADQRDWTTNQSNQNADRDWQQYQYEKGFGRDVYSEDRSFGQDAAIQNYNTALAGLGQNWDQKYQAQQSNLGQYNTNRQFGADQAARYDANRFNAWNANTGYGQQQAATDYGLMTDAYGRQLADKTNQYGMIGDLVNIGTSARSGLSQGVNNYYDSMADLYVQGGNAKAASSQQMGDNNSLMGMIGL